jgi:hypothetical protein
VTTEFTGRVRAYEGPQGRDDEIILTVHAAPNSHKYSFRAGSGVLDWGFARKWTAVTLDGRPAKNLLDVIAFVVGNDTGTVWATPVSPDWSAEADQVIPCAGIEFVTVTAD